LLISVQLYTCTIPPLEISPPPKTLTYSDIRSYRGTCSAITLPTLLLIASTRSTASSTAAAPASIENVRVYLAIAVSARVNIVYKRVTKIAKDV